MDTVLAVNSPDENVEQESTAELQLGPEPEPEPEPMSAEGYAGPASHGLSKHKSEAEMIADVMEENLQQEAQLELAAEFAQTLLEEKEELFEAKGAAEAELEKLRKQTQQLQAVLAEKEEEVKKSHATIAALKSNERSSPKAAAARAYPQWIPNSDVSSCMLGCGSQKFSAFWRRHHCRYCGWIVCGNCLKHQIAVDRWLCSKAHTLIRSPPSTADASVMKKVCDSCFTYAPAEIKARKQAIGTKGS